VWWAWRAVLQAWPVLARVFQEPGLVWRERELAAWDWRAQQLAWLPPWLVQEWPVLAWSRPSGQSLMWEVSQPPWQEPGWRLVWRLGREDSGQTARGGRGGVSWLGEG